MPRSRGVVDESDRGWCVVEGGGFYEAHSTVVRVTADGTVGMIRAGDITFDEIDAYVDSIGGA